MPHADILIENARVLTMTPAQPRAEAVATRANRIIGVGTKAEMQALAGPATRRIDAQGCTVLPGLIEAHLHLFLGGYGLGLLQLGGLRGPAALGAALQAYARTNPAEGLLICKGADYTLLGAGHPITRQALDAALPDRPVLLIAGDHHTAWANTVALERAGLLHGRPTPPGTEIVMGSDGTATGELREHGAYAHVLALRTSGGREDLGFAGREPQTPPSPAERAADEAVMARALRHCASYGFTSVHNMDGNIYQLELLAALERAGGLICRTEVPFHMTPEHPLCALQTAVQMTRDFASEKLRAGRIKLFMDGVIDSGTAFMLAPFTDGTNGTPLHSAARFAEIAIEADRLGLQISVHAIGDGAVRRVLDGYAAARASNGARDARHRIEHIEVLHPDDLPRLRDLGVVASMQPSHPPGAMDFPFEPWRSMVGEARLAHGFPVAAIHAAGVPIAFASDWPITDINPMRGIKAALLRPPLGAGCPDNRIPLMQALAHYTTGGAFAGFDEARLGRIAPGLLADLVVMDHDLEALPPEALDTARAACTLSDGQIVWES